jgi:PAS domain S-box-containing protein
MTPRGKTSKLWLAFGGLLVVVLLALVFTLGSLNIPFEPRQPTEVLILFALSTFIVAALLVFGLVLTRSLLRLWAERRAEKLGARFRTKMVLGAMGISLLPVIFMFLASYALMNRTLAKWFPRSLEIATEESRSLLNELVGNEFDQLTNLAQEARTQAGGDPQELVRTAIVLGADAAWVVDGQETVIGGGLPCAKATTRDCVEKVAGTLIRKLPRGPEVWRANGAYYLAARSIHLHDGMYLGALVVGRKTTPDLAAKYADIEIQLAAYEVQKQGFRAFYALILLTLLLFTLLLIFSATWVALFLSKQVTVPIQALAEATQEVSRGNFAHRVDVQARDELGILVQSFNQMTEQLGHSRRQIDEFTRNLQQAIQELERRRKLIEAILENIPTGVLSLDAGGNIARMNSAVVQIVGQRAREARTPADLLGEDAARGVQQLMRKSLRMGAASKELEIALPDPSGRMGAGRVLHAAVTVSSLGPRRANPGYVLVIDDLTELLRAQKAAAWQEVAQRIAHEIKNPLTPIQLSAQRLTRFVERQTGEEAQAGMPVPPGEFAPLVAECAGLIEREVGALKALVDEFTEFARFPTAKPVSTDVNAIVSSALEVFSGRLEGASVRTQLARDLPTIKADPELLRRVVINLIDNAAEAMEGSATRELSLETRLDAEGEAVEIVVADSGHGISPEDKDKLFLPRFSTRERGTGLGLAIAGRIIAEHHGTIRVEDNVPIGARFVVRLPTAEASAAQGVPNDNSSAAGG